MNLLIFFVCFMICWAAFGYFLLYIYKRICYNILDFCIKIGDDEIQERINNVWKLGD